VLQENLHFDWRKFSTSKEFGAENERLSDWGKIAAL
jgi:hypothetical protein